MHAWAALVIVIVGCSASTPPARAPRTTAADPWAAPQSPTREEALTESRHASRAPAPVVATPPQPQPPEPQQLQPPQPLAPAPAPVVACPAPVATQPKAPPLATHLAVWRSRADLPVCLAPHVPVDFDFSREMLAGDLGSYVQRVTIKSPARPLLRSKGTIIVEEQAEFVDCPPCRGVADETRPEPMAVPAVTLWRLPAVKGVSVFCREKPHPMTRPCPPPTCA